ncbi:MAG: SAM-dependent methyltransferase [Hyphomicrobiales bacterium]
MEFNNDYWNNRYKNQQTGWDIGYISTPIKEYIDQIEDKDIKILIPGAGNCYEGEYIYNQGFKNLHILDFAETPLRQFKEKVPNFPDKQLIQDDFFKHSGQYDLIIEQAFFCSLPKDMRHGYCKKIYDLLSKNGKLAGLLFSFEFPPSDNPPFGGCKDEYIELLTQYFSIKHISEAYNSISQRQGKELFFLCVKKQT